MLVLSHAPLYNHCQREMRLFKEICDYFTSVMMFKSTNGLTTPYLTDSIVRGSETHDRNTRLANSYDVHVPSYNSEILKRSFVYNVSVRWNSLCNEIKLADNLLLNASIKI